MSKRLRSQSRERIVVVSAAIRSHWRLRRPGGRDSAVAEDRLGATVMVILLLALAANCRKRLLRMVGAGRGPDRWSGSDNQRRNPGAAWVVVGSADSEITDANANDAYG
jgi:hypothetical protein